MLVDNPVQPSFTSYTPSFEDFFNMDLLAGPSNQAPGSGGSSPSSSPSNSFAPLTPPEIRPMDDFSFPSESFFSFSQEDEQSKLSAFAVPPATAPGYDFLSLSSINQMSSPESSGSGSGSGHSSEAVDSPVGIDPQLVGTPAASKAASEFDEEEEGEDEDQYDEMQTIPEDMVIAPLKVGGKGKSNRKGTVREGGIVKRSASAAEKKENAKPTGLLSTTSTEPDDWRPSPEEYKKMSSKEKRQLRNKISARNFRVRRKEYIATLEGDIAERDRLIDAIRSELGSTKNENVALRQEIAQLKKALLEGRGRADTPVLPPPAPLPTVPASVLASSSSSSSPSPPPTLPRSPLLTPNTQKDLPTSPRIGARAFWGGAHGMGGFGSITPVHTTLVPDLSSVLSGKPVAGRKSPVLQENINPTLNGSPASLASLLSGRGEDKPKEHQQSQLPMGAFDAFSDINPFTLKSMDAYRMHLWGKMAQQQATHRQAQPQQSAQSPSGLAGNLRPHYFAKSPSLSALLSGKSVTSSSAPLNPYPTPPSSPPMSHSTLSSSQNQQRDAPSAQQAMLASIASQTLIGKLGAAFWDAFARPSGPLGPNGASKREWDADKVRRVMEGTAVVRIVDVEPQQQPAPAAPSARAASQERQQNNTCASACVSVTDILAESMATLNLGRK